MVMLEGIWVVMEILVLADLVVIVLETVIEIVQVMANEEHF